MFRALLVVFVVVVRYFFSQFIFTNFTRKYWRLMNFDKKKTPLQIPCAMGKITWDVGKIENSNPRKVKILHLLKFEWHFDK